MKVKDLIKQLQALNPEADAIVAEDPEGNGFRKVAEVHQYKYRKDVQNEMELWDVNDQEAPKKAKLAVVIWP